MKYYKKHNKTKHASVSKYIRHKISTKKLKPGLVASYDRPSFRLKTKRTYSGSNR